MRVPFTIPKKILRFYTRKLDPEALEKSYEGRLLISEDTTWDKEITPTLAQQCLVMIQDEFLFYDKLLEFFNSNKQQSYGKEREQWQKDFAEYSAKKALYDKKLAAYEMKIAMYGESAIDDPNFDDDDDDDDPDGVIQLDEKGRPIEPDKVAEDFAEYEPVHQLLDVLNDDDRVQIIEDIELDLVPLPLAVKIIPDEYYWERQARDRWQVFNVKDHNKSWRRLYMEKYAWDAIERFHPADDDFEKLKEELEIVGKEVIRLRIQNLIPICFGTPDKQVEVKPFEGDNEFGPDSEFDAGFGDETMFEDPDDQSLDISEDIVKSWTKNNKKGNNNNNNNNKQDGKKETKKETDFIIPPQMLNAEMDRQDSSHLDFNLILPIFTALKELYIVFEMVEMGMDWEDRFFRFTDTDCLNLAGALSFAPTLEKVEILRSKMTGEQCKTLVREGLIKMPHLKYLNLNYNHIDDVGARAVARLLIDENSRPLHTLHTVRLARNRIHNRGGKALAYALTKNKHLQIMDLRVNAFGNPAGADFGHALVKNTSLIALFLGANRMTEDAAYIFGKMLFHNQSLKELDLSSNDFGKKGGEFLALGMRNNKTILRLDVRLCNVGLDFEYDIGLHLRNNRTRISAYHSILDGEDYGPNETESAILDLEDISEEESDEEEVEEDEDEDEEEEDDEDDDYTELSQNAYLGANTITKAVMKADVSGPVLESAQLAIKDMALAGMLVKAIGAGGTSDGLIEKVGDVLHRTQRKEIRDQQMLATKATDAKKKSMKGQHSNRRLSTATATTTTPPQTMKMQSPPTEEKGGKSSITVVKEPTEMKTSEHVLT